MEFALKPGKPICLAAHHGRPVVILPGFPTSAIFTFHEFVAPVIRRKAGRPDRLATTVPARLAVRLNSEIGRTEYLLVGLVAGQGADRSPTTPLDHESRDDLVAYPIGKGSGSVTTFSYADGFLSVGRHVELVEAGTRVDVQLLGTAIEPADLIVIGSHCIGLDRLLGNLQRQGWRTKFLAVGSTAGLEAARRGECDLAGIHLYDPALDLYNEPFLDPTLQLIPGYSRRQGIVFRRGDPRFTGKTPEAAVATACSSDDCLMINRNQGSGTRILIDTLLARVSPERQPPGYPNQARNHNAVAAAIRQSRADWGVAIEAVTWDDPDSRDLPLDFLFLADEQFDFVMPNRRADRPAVKAFLDLLDATDRDQILVRPLPQDDSDELSPRAP